MHPLFIKPKRNTTIVMVLILLAGAAGSVFAGITVRASTRESLLARAVTAAGALDVSEVSSLKGVKQDLSTHAYQELKQRITKIKSNNLDLSYVYLLGKRDGRIYYAVDSEPVGSPLNANPGDLNNSASDKIKGTFIVGDAFIEGPKQNTYSNSVSALVPILNSSNNQTVAILGVDMPATTYYWQIFVSSVVPLLLAAIPFAGLLRDRKLEAKEREINQLKTQFVSVASHELRSPLAGTLWAVQTMLKPGANKNLETSQTDLLSDIYSSTASSLATVNEILDFSIFDRDEAIKLQHETVDLIPVLKEAQKMLKLSSQEADVHVNFSGKWPTLVETVGDVGALKRAFSNVVSNAVKYSRPKTKVELVYHFQNGEHVIAVRDHGIGIPKSEQSKVLSGYYRATNATKYQSRGTGLGLWITRLIIERHGGRLWIKSKENDGTIVFIAMPTPDTKPKVKPE